MNSVKPITKDELNSLYLHDPQQQHQAAPCIINSPKEKFQDRPQVMDTIELITMSKSQLFPSSSSGGSIPRNPQHHQCGKPRVMGLCHNKCQVFISNPCESRTHYSAPYTATSYIQVIMYPCLAGMVLIWATNITGDQISKIPPQLITLCHQ